MRPRRLKLGKHVGSGRMYHVYRNQAAALNCPFISSFPPPPQFSTLKCFVTVFSGTVRPRRLKLGTDVDTGISQLLLIRAFIFFIFLSLQFSIFIFFFVTLLSGTVRPRRLKIDTPVGSGQMYHVYRNQLLLLIHPFISSFFFLSNFHH